MGVEYFRLGLMMADVGTDGDFTKGVALQILFRFSNNPLSPLTFDSSLSKC